ncbi:MAG: FliH/SctL family protein [Pseudomonadota bacterium]
MDKLVRNSPAPAGSTSHHHAFPTLSVPDECIVGESGEGGAFQRIRFGADGGRKGDGNQAADAPQSHEAQLRTAAKQGYDDGFSDGKSTGVQEARKEMDAALQQFRRAYIEVEKYRKEIYLNAEAVAVELAMAIARKVVHVEISTNPDIVVSVIRDALTRVVDQERIRIHVNPSDIALVTGAVDEFAGRVKSLDTVIFEPDGAVSPGGCRIVTNFGEVDAGIGTQLAMIEEALNAAFAKPRIGR